jgi:hypothetical protein
VTKTALGFVVMGFIRFFVKLIFIVREKEETQGGREGGVFMFPSHPAHSVPLQLHSRSTRSSSVGRPPRPRELERKG